MPIRAWFWPDCRAQRVGEQTRHTRGALRHREVLAVGPLEEEGLEGPHHEHHLVVERVESADVAVHAPRAQQSLDAVVQRPDELLVGRLDRDARHLGNELLVQRPRGSRSAVQLGEEEREALAGVLALAPCFVEGLEKERVAADGELVNEIVLGGKVIEERLPRDVGPLADLRDGRRSDPALGEERRCRLGDPIGRLAPAAFGAAL